MSLYKTCARANRKPFRIFLRSDYDPSSHTAFPPTPSYNSGRSEYSSSSPSVHDDAFRDCKSAILFRLYDSQYATRYTDVERWCKSKSRQSNARAPTVIYRIPFCTSRGSQTFTGRFRREICIRGYDRRQRLKYRKRCGGGGTCTHILKFHIVCVDMTFP